MYLDDVQLTETPSGDVIEYRGHMATVTERPDWPALVRDMARHYRAEGLDSDLAGVKANRARDRWLYTLPDGEQYTHPTRSGARHMCRRWFVDSGIILVPTDNSHLDETDRGIAFDLDRARAAVPGPRVGDLVWLPDFPQPMHRICGIGFDGERFGLTQGGSFALSAGPVSLRPGPNASYSGGLDWSPEWRLDRLTDTGETRPVRFWFFSHGIPGAGCGVDAALPGRVFKFNPLEDSQ